MQNPEPQSEHRWLQRLVGEWTMEAEFTMAPDQPPTKTTGAENVRSLGGLWTVGEMEGGMAGGDTDRSIMTLSYDPSKQRFVGTFVASCMTHLWVYSGSLDSSGKFLTLDTEGPSFSGDGTLAKYQDIIEFLSEDHRTLSSQFLGADGEWQRFMTAHYRRKA